MFDRIAGRYDRANSLMTLGQDSLWRRRAARAAIDGHPASSVLDCACGTGKLASAVLRAGALRVVGLDFSERMVEIARDGHPGIKFMTGDVLHLPFADGAFDAATIGFGLRNLHDPIAGLREMARVVRPGGRIAVLEAVRPEGPLAPIADLLATWGPRMAGAVIGEPAAYRYLTESVRAFATAPELGSWFVRAGIAKGPVTRMGLGSVALAVGTVPG